VENLEFSSLPQSLFDLELHTGEGLQFLEFEGAKIAFDFQPSKEESCQNLLVLVNGYQRNRLDFRAFRKKIEKLSPNTATLSLDNRYCGQTIVTSSDALTIFRMARDVSALAAYFCKALNLKDYSLLGISMGGMIAQTLASGNSCINKLFLVSTTSGGKGRTWPVEVKDPTTLEYKSSYETLDSTKKHMRRYFGERFLKSSPLLFEMMCKTLVKTNTAENPETGDGAKTQFYASANFDGVENLLNIKAKTLIVSGDEDHIIPLENAHYLSNSIPSSSLIVYNEVGHLILIEEPEKFANDICGFLK
jgi:pimeloyl-ACP methyl ester carboxylesterase